MKFKLLNLRENILIEELNQIHVVDLSLLEHKETKYINNNIVDKLNSKNSVDLRGTKISTYEDLAALVKMFRDTRFEIFRIFYLKNGVIVGSDSLTSKLPDRVSAFINFSRLNSEKQDQFRSWVYYEHKMKRLNADSYILAHNHTSGKLEYSPQDMYISKLFKENINGFLGHIIIGINGYSIIDYDLKFNIYEYNDEELKNNTKLSSIMSHVNYIKNYNVDNVEQFSILYLNNDDNVVGLEHCNSKAANDKNFYKYIANQKKENGAVAAYIYSENQDIEQLVDYFYGGIYNKIISNVIINIDGNILLLTDIVNIPVNELNDKIQKFSTYKLHEPKGE